ncbi:MAG: putative ABC transporter permease [Lachnospiraceae bacterium]|nr:putative ABC transporter permease [Lachnospiraceae bacterium]
MDIIKILFFITIYSFLGWCVEVVYHTVKYGDFSNRGLVNGPVCTIYGFGFTGVVLLLDSFRDNVFLLFAASLVLTTALEFLTGWVLEKLFHEKWWDYSKEPFNLRGYICVRFSLIWGLACTSAMVTVHPLVEKCYRLLPRRLCIVGLCVAGAIYIADWSVTVIEIRKLQIRLGIVKGISDTMDDIANFLGSNLHESTLDVMKKGEEGKEFLQETHDAYVEKREAFQLSMAENREIFLGRMEYEMDRLKKNMSEAREGVAKSSRERIEGMMNRLKTIRARYEKTSFRITRTENRLASAFPALDLRKKPGRRAGGKPKEAPSGEQGKSQ